jgi:hypothetical protein
MLVYVWSGEDWRATHYACVCVVVGIIEARAIGYTLLVRSEPVVLPKGHKRDHGEVNDS